MKIITKFIWATLSEKEQFLWLQQIPTIYRAQVLRLIKGQRTNLPDDFNAKKCIFVHIPKTAGTSITSTLFRNTRPGHQPISWYESIDPEATKRFFKFAFVRNPWDRLVSSYFYMASRTSRKRETLEWVDFIQSFESFDHFVKAWVNEDNVKLNITFYPQHKFLINKFGMNHMDFVGRFENIDRDFKEICRNLGVQISLPHDNKSPRKHYAAYYNDETRDIVAQAYKKDIELFGYQF
jgi:chondroitin 4-sulfotransferase 11